MARAKCANCPREGNLGNIIRYYKLYNANGRRISIPLCFRCEMQVKTIRRPA